MKQILTYISPDKDFNEEHKMAVKIQIDNSIRMGWKPEDIMLITNFEYEYNGIQSVVIGDENYCFYHWPATKIYVIVELFRRGLIEDDLYWYHDFDCFQLNPFADIEKELAQYDMGLTQYGRMPRLCSASMFFKKSARDIFIQLKEFLDETRMDEENGFAKLINSDVSLQKRIKKLNITYAFQKWNLRHCYAETNKPIKAVHFHLTPDKYDFFVRGNNKVNLKIIPEELINIFHNHGFRQNNSFLLG